MYNGYQVFPGSSDQGVTLTPQSLLVPWSRKSRAIPLLPLWAVTACTDPQCLYEGALYLTFHDTHIIWTERGRQNYEPNGIVWKIKQIMQHVLKMNKIALFPEYIKWMFFHVCLCMWAQIFKINIAPVVTSVSSPTSYAMHSRFFPNNKVLHMWSWPLISVHTDAKERRPTHQSPSGPSAFTLASPVHPAFLHLWMLAVTSFTCHKHFNRLTLARMGWKQRTAGRLGEASRDSITTIRGTSLYGLHTAPPLSYLQTVSYRIPGFHEQFSGVLQAYVVYSKTDKRNFDNL